MKKGFLSEALFHVHSHMAASYSTICLWGLAFVACHHPEEKQESTVAKDKVAQNGSEEFVPIDTIAHLLAKAAKMDTLEFDNWRPFIFYKSGYFLNRKVKSALVVNEISDTTIAVKLYSLQGDNWLLNSTIENLDGPGIAFGPKFDDYYFDGQTDVYIQVTISNGYSLSRGHLLTINPFTLKLQNHPEARDLGNMRPDIKSNSVISDEVIWCKSDGFKEVCKRTNKWDKGVLKFIDKQCPCEPGNQ